jgi:phage-related baseplate assembly protein
VKAVAVAHRRGDQCIDIDVLDACDAHVDIGAAQIVWRVNAIVDVDAALRAQEMMRDRIVAAILLSFAGGAKVFRFRAYKPEPRVHAITAIAFDRARGEVEFRLEA